MMMEAIDANEYLIQFLGSIDNLPSEINYHFTELSNKEREIDALTKRIERRKKRLWCLYDGISFEEDSDCSVVESVYEEQVDDDDVDDDESDDDGYDDGNEIELMSSRRKKHRVARVITEFEDEEMLKEKVLKDFDRVSQLQDEKIEISDKVLSLVERHIKHLDEDLDSLFPHQNLRDSSTTIPTSPGRSELPIRSLQVIAQHPNIITSQANNNNRITSQQSNMKTSPPPPSPLSSTSSISNSTYDYNKGIFYPSAGLEATEEGQFTLPLLPNPSNSTSRIGRDSLALSRRNLAMSSNQNSLRRRRQNNNLQNGSSIYTSNVDSTNNITSANSTANTSNFPRSIKIRYSNGGELLHNNGNSSSNHLSSTSDRNIGLGNNNNVNLNSQAYDSPFVSTDGASFSSSNFIQSVDPNEPVYCICRQVSFGEMIGCDGENCPIEWYHLECVNLKAVPEGRWYCDHCIGNVTQVKKRKRGRPVGSKKPTGIDTYDVGFASPTFSTPTTPSHSYHGSNSLSSSSTVLQNMSKFSLASRANKMPRISKSS